MSWVNPFFEVTVGNTVYKFGDANDNQPRMMEGRFEYSYSDSTGVTANVALTENTIRAALNAMNIPYSEFSWWWHVPPSVQSDLEDEGWTEEQILSLTIGDHLSLRITIIQTLQ